MVVTRVDEGYRESDQHQEEGPARFAAVNHGDQETGTRPAATFKKLREKKEESSRREVDVRRCGCGCRGVWVGGGGP